MTRRRREPTPEEIALFEATLKAPVQIAKKISGIRVKPGAAKAKVNKSTKPNFVDKFEPLGLDGTTKSRLVKGNLAPDSRIDLHGMTEAVAHRALITFIRGAAMRGHRLVLVVTGKGLPDDPFAPFDLEFSARKRGVLRMMAPRWLKEPEMARLVADIRTAHRRHGGEGALYVYLRKPG